MTDQTEQAGRPRHCPECGTELAAGFTGRSPAETTNSTDGAPHPVTAKDLCPNPRCPAKQQNAPGSLGGDNGGG